MKLKVMTYNIAGGRNYSGELPAKTVRPEACASVIAAYSPDIVGLNEIDFNHPRSGSIHLAAEVAAATGIPYENRFGRATELGRPGARGSYGNAFLSKHVILSSEALQVPDPEDKSEPTYYETRGIFRNIILVEDREIEVLVTHFGLAKSERAETMKMLTKFIKERTRPIIVMGDFNVWDKAVKPEDNRIAEIKGLYELGVEIEENSELDLLVSYKAHENDPRIPDVCADMAGELGACGNCYPELLPRMAQFELTLLDWAEAHKGARQYVCFADKCWPAFPEQFGFEPCYVNSRLASRGIPVACEVDIYGALSEYIGSCITGDAVTLLDINNSVPKYLYNEDIAGKFDYALTDTFMGFHCGNTPSCKMCADRAVKYQLIQHRLLEPAGSDPDFTRGTLEGDIAASPITFYRLQCDSEGVLRAYIAQGEVLPVATRSFGGIGVFAIPEMARFYRHVLIEKRYPHHGAVAFSHVGKYLFEVFKYFGVKDVAYNQPATLPYPTENPWA